MDRDSKPIQPNGNEQYTAHDEITATATSTAIDISGAKAIAISLTEGGTVNNRSGVLSVTVSTDGSTFVTYNMIVDNIATTNSQTLTRVASKTRNSAGTDILFMDPITLGALRFMKVVVTITDGGTPTGNFTVLVNVLR